jgi:hypothetical protein
MQKGQQTEDQTWTKLGPGKLGTWWRHAIIPSTSSEFIICSGKTRLSSRSQGRGCDIAILENRRNLWQLLCKCKYLRKNSCTASCPLLWLALCQLKPAVYWAQLHFLPSVAGAVLNSNLQFICYGCAYVLHSPNMAQTLWLMNVFSEFQNTFHVLSTSFSDSTPYLCSAELGDSH